MKKEKYILEIKRKKSITFRVVIKVNGKSREFGSFNTDDYPTPTDAKNAAIDCRNKALNEIRQNRYIEHDLTVEEVYEKTKELIVTNVKSQKRHDDSFYPSVPPDLRNKKISEVTAADIQLALNNYAATHSQGQVDKAMTVWRQIYQVCFLLELPVIDRSRMVQKPKSKIPTKRRKKHCTDDELELFLEALNEYGLDRQLTENITYAFRIMQYLGLRPQEAFAVCSEDIDLRNGLFHVQHSIGSTVDGTRQLIVTKTPWSIRTLPIPSGLRPHLEDLIRNRSTEPLLLAPDGLPFEIDDVDDLIRHVGLKCGIRITPYMMRHNFATEMVRKDLKATQNMMGHDTAVMTLRYVQDTTIERMKELLDPDQRN